MKEHQFDGSGEHSEAPLPDRPLAFDDPEFLWRGELRAVRWQLELLRPELRLSDEEIDSIVVVFGSARFPSPEVVEAELTAASAASSERDPQSRERFKRAEALAARTRWYEEARRFAQLVSSCCQTERCACVITTGGGPGIMEAANRGAHEIGKKTLGFNIALPAEQTPNEYITPGLSFRFHYFATRKMHFLLRAAAVVIFPGGFGTLDELFEVLTLIQTGKMAPIPVLLFGQEFWEKVIDFNALVDHGTIGQPDLKLITWVNTAEEAWDAIRTARDSGASPGLSEDNHGRCSSDS